MLGSDHSESVRALSEDCTGTDGAEVQMMTAKATSVESCKVVGGGVKYPETDLVLWYQESGSR